jgi:DNA-binding IclR family transcriptional regulator
MVRQGVDAVERALSIVTAFKKDDTALSLAELARRTGLYKSTILRLIASLERFGFLKRNDKGEYCLGPELWHLGKLYRQAFDLEAVVRPALVRLVEKTHETASFYVRQADERVCLYRLNSPRAVRHHLEEGVRLSLDRGAAGRILLAYGGAGGATYTRIRNAGYYVSRGERDPDIAAAAVPVFDSAGALRGALAVSALLTRFDARAQKAAIDALHKEAAMLASQIPGA